MSAEPVHPAEGQPQELVAPVRSVVRPVTWQPRTATIPRRRRVKLPLILFLATCVSTYWAGATGWRPYLYMDSATHIWAAIRGGWLEGLLYMAAVLGILLTHEMGHFVTTLRHRIPATLPFFIPIPFTPLGTMGAVIAMDGARADRRQMFDLGLSGPLAGLIVAVPITWIGIMQLQPASPRGTEFLFHNPLILQGMIAWLRPDLPDGSCLYITQLNPFVMAGWVGMLVTGLNMLPVSQLDGGHVTYALLGRRAHTLARAFIVGAILAVILFEQYNWVLMLVLVILIGTDHPPTADDGVPLGRTRRLLGAFALAIPILCFPPMGITLGP